MLRNIFLVLIPILLLCGCARTNTYLKPSSACTPLSDFDTIVIAPINGDSALVEEGQYAHLPKFIARATTERVVDKLEGAHVFRKVVQSSECISRAIKLDGTIYTLIHNRRKYHVGIRGQVINCQTGESLYKYNNDDESDSEVVKLPGSIADNIVDGIKAKMVCRQPPK